MTDHLTSYAAKMHRQDPESWAERAEAKTARVGRVLTAERAAELGLRADVIDPLRHLVQVRSGPGAAHDTGPAAENIARAFEG